MHVEKLESGEKAGRGGGGGGGSDAPNSQGPPTQPFLGTHFRAPASERCCCPRGARSCCWQVRLLVIVHTASCVVKVPPRETQHGFVRPFASQWHLGCWCSVSSSGFAHTLNQAHNIQAQCTATQALVIRRGRPNERGRLRCRTYRYPK